MNCGILSGPLALTVSQYKRDFEMQLITIQRFREIFFEPGSRPAINTIRNWIDDDEIDGGRRIGRKYYVDIDAWRPDADAIVEHVLDS